MNNEEIKLLVKECLDYRYAKVKAIKFQQYEEAAMNRDSERTILRKIYFFVNDGTPGVNKKFYLQGYDWGEYERFFREYCIEKYNIDVLTTSEETINKLFNRISNLKELGI